MATSRQLYEYQVVDQQIKSAEDTLKQKVIQQRESDALIAARTKLAAEKQSLDDLKKKQRGLEIAVSDITAKIGASEDQLYGGKIRNPKELSGLQAEVNTLKSKRGEQENSLLEIMERAEQSQKDAESAAEQFKTVEAGWHADQKQLVTEIEQLQARLTELRRGLEAQACEIDRESLDLYLRLKKAKGVAVSRVEQGMCRGCRISVSSAELQGARSGKLAFCSNCGRIMHLP